MSSTDNEDITKPFSETEIKEALLQMENNKASGPDSIPVEFYKKYWDIIKGDIIEMIKDLHEGRLDVSRINYGVITLLPKVLDV
jgi:hypothetical protein